MRVTKESPKGKKGLLFDDFRKGDFGYVQSKKGHHQGYDENCQKYNNEPRDSRCNMVSGCLNLSFFSFGHNPLNPSVEKINESNDNGEDYQKQNNSLDCTGYVCAYGAKHF